MKALKKIFVIILIILVVLVLGRNVIIKSAASAGAKAVVGLGLDIGTFNLGLFKSEVEIRDLKVYNPPGFEEKLMVDLPEAYVDYELASFLTGNPHIEEFRLHLKEFIIVKNAKGEVNIEKIKAVSDKAPVKEEKKEAPKKTGPAPKIQIDNLSLKVERVVFKEYNEAGDMKEKVININLDENYKDIQSLEAVVLVVVAKTMTKAGLSAITNVDVSGLASGVTEGLKNVAGTATQTLGDAAGKSTEAVKDAADSLKGMIKNPFGKE